MRAALGRWWRRLREALASRLLRRPPPGRWIEGHASSWHGVVGLRPWVLPRRRYRLYVPRGWIRGRPLPLVTLIHGCRQTPEAFAQGARVEAAADRAGVLVLMPDQKDRANPYRCWNWFDGRTWHGKGEAAIVAAMIEKVWRRFAVDRERSVVAGLSSGAALAAIVGLRFPHLVRGVFAHAGLACGAAASVFTALTVMRRGPENDVGAIGREARRDAHDHDHDHDVAITIVQGTDDDVVARLNGEALARQYLAFNGIDVPPGANTTLPVPDGDVGETLAPARAVRTREWRRDGHAVVRLVEVRGLGHAWSGGDASHPFHDPAPPDLTAMLVDWTRAPG